MKLISTLFQVLVAVAFIYIGFVAVASIYIGSVVTETNHLHDQVNLVSAQVDGISNAMHRARQDATDEALKFAPKGMSIYQLRGTAQVYAQSLMDKLTTKHKLPRYELPTIIFRPALRHVVSLTGEVSWSAAGQTTSCGSTGYHPIYLNELLFLRNYEEFMYQVIPHEISHILTCMLGGYVVEENEDLDAAAHGEEWENAMRDIGFVNPADFSTHMMDTTPILLYQRDLAFKINEAFKDIDNE